MSEPFVVESWIWSCNVRALLHLLSMLGGYRDDEWDQGALDAGLEVTDARDPEGWFHYPLEGAVRLDVSMAVDPGSDVVRVRVAGPGDTSLAAKVDAMLMALSEYELVEVK